ncbi:heterocyst-inhibiting protein PatX [Calothrix sp. PCC 6303]|uniref:heterocyst-inhibiting protein PatX n=1 Tax=Calothrix sp. PCC 6303 TaxID=1170562 RepID=UPI0002A033F6|nr:hypothetical protein Cal6303_3524 [Calothrix sp. PCC 6303]
MRVAISLLATTFVLGSFAINNQGQTFNLKTEVLLSAKPKTNTKPKSSKRPERPPSYRGSGRRELV